MKYRRGRALLAALATLFSLVVASATAQELSTEVFPSEDELLEALHLGDISYDQYVLLREVARLGIDSASAHLLDEITNLSSFRRDRYSVRGLEQEQRRPFERHPRETGPGLVRKHCGPR